MYNYVRKSTWLYLGISQNAYAEQHMDDGRERSNRYHHRIADADDTKYTRHAFWAWHAFDN